jgi:huntingtin
VSFVAEECLNKTIKALLDSNLGRLQVELCRFIRKNGSERCLKAALTRFAELSHLIRPHKCRHFAEFLLKEDTMKKIASRNEESIQNVLTDVMTKLSSSLCCCMTDQEIKVILKLVFSIQFSN